MDETFDAHATLIELEAKEEEERLQAVLAEIRQETMDAKNGKMPTASTQHDDSPGEDSRNDSRTDEEPACVRRAEDKLMLAIALAFGGETSGTGNGGPSEKKPSRQEKRAEARKEAKAKAKDEN